MLFLAGPILLISQFSFLWLNCFTVGLSTKSTPAGWLLAKPKLLQGA